MMTPPSRSPDFGARLRHLRHAAGLTQMQLAARSGLSVRGISDLERGLREPRVTTLRRLARGLDVPLFELEELPGSEGLDQCETQAPPSLLPPQTTSLIGRVGDVQRIQNILEQPDIRLVTITGAGGVGKTRTALQVADALHHRFAAGAVFVDLAPVSDAQLVLPTIARSLGVHGIAGPQHLDRLIRALQTRDVLVVLDNVEHVIDAAVDLPVLLVHCPDLVILATSREHLNVSGEHEYPLAPLAVPDHGEPTTAEAIADVDAVQLFLQRARMVRPDFALTDATADAIADICRWLDGLPLAIELAAARVNVLLPTALRDRLETLLPVLSGGGRDVPERQRTMENTIAWSYNLLSIDEQRLFRHITVFSGGFTLDAFEATSAVLTGTDVTPFEILSSLVDKHLVHMQVSEHETSRYVLLEPIREFGREALIREGEDRASRSIHADWCLRFAESIVPTLRPILRPGALEGVEAEYANLRAALTWLDDQHQWSDMMKVAANLGWFWYLSGRWDEGLSWLRRAIDQHQGAATPDYVQALLSGGHLGLVTRDPEAGPKLEQAHALAQASGNTDQEYRAVVLLGIMANYQEDYHHAETRFADAQALLEKLDDPWSPLVVDFQLGVIAYGQGRWDDAVEKLEATKSAAQAIGDLLIPAWCTRFLTQIACEQQDIPRATELLRDGNHPGFNVGIGQTYPQYLSTAAMLADAIGHHSSTARLLGAAAVAINDLPFPSPVQNAYKRAEATAREHLGHDTFVEMWQAGRRMRRVEIESEIARILAVAKTHHADSTPTILTPREHEVLHLIISGYSNPEIATALFISPHTAARHVTNILSKFNVETRAAAVAYAFQHDLV